jgi:hypothetical protein
MQKGDISFLVVVKLIFDSRYFYSFTYLTPPVTIYLVPPNDPRMHCDECDLFWEKANSPNVCSPLTD